MRKVCSYILTLLLIAKILLQYGTIYVVVVAETTGDVSNVHTKIKQNYWSQSIDQQTCLNQSRVVNQRADALRLPDDPNFDVW